MHLKYLLNNDNFYEIVGAFIGNGYLGNYGRTKYVEFYGNPTKDKKYMGYLKTIIKNTLNFSPIIKIREGAIRFRYPKEFYNLLCETGFTPGRKAGIVCIPQKLINQNKTKINKIIRGITDTDGYVYLDKRKIYKKPYPRIDITTKSTLLADQLYKILKNQGFRINTRKIRNIKGEYNRLEIHGKKQALLWIKKVGFSNKKHLDKIATVAQG